LPNIFTLLQILFGAKAWRTEGKLLKENETEKILKFQM
jgi:hypothetical protein